MKKNIISLSAVLISALFFGQVGVNTTTPQTTMDVSAKRDTGGTITDNTQLIGLQAPRLTRTELTNNTATYGTGQQGAQIYITDVSGGTAAGQRINITATGYYYFDGALWQKIASSNIYNTNDTFTANRTATIPSGQWLNFNGPGYVGIGGVDPIAKLNVNGFIQFGPADSNYGVGKVFNDSAGEKYGLTQSTYFPVTGDASSPGTRIYTSGRPGVLGHISFGKYTSATNYTEWGRFAQNGNFGINTVAGTGSNNPTEKLDVNGNTRLRGLPLNGTANAIYTKSDGSVSAAQDQTFTATRTVVADANGVLGYVAGLPGTGGTPPTGSINIGETISQIYSVPAATANVSTFNLGAYVTSNSLPSLPVIDGLQINLQGVNATYYDPRIYNVSSSSELVSYQSFATQVNENRTSLNNNLAASGYLQIDANNIVYWTNALAEVETANVQVQVNASTYRWYEFKWWCMEVSGQKKIFLSITRKA